LPHGHVLSLHKGDITDEPVDAIVSAAHTKRRRRFPGG
jgi:O-acetyl-ADP-ribose deacetylase (regulator of RNase III)